MTERLNVRNLGSGSLSSASEAEQSLGKVYDFLNLVEMSDKDT